MRIMTFNVQHFLDYKNQIIDIDLFSEFIDKFDVDVCGLNEVRGNGPLEGYTDQTNALADKLHFERYFGEAIKVKGKNPYGNALISRHKIKSVETVKIPNPVFKLERVGYEPRCVIKAVIEIENTEIMFLVCHMGLAKAERKNAVKTICNLLDESPLPAVVMGDFNAEPDAEVFIPLFERLSDTDALAKTKNLPTFPSYEPEIKIDYLLCRGLECTYVETVNKVVSDHLPIIAHFNVKDL